MLMVPSPKVLPGTMSRDPPVMMIGSPASRDGRKRQRQRQQQGALHGVYLLKALPGPQRRSQSTIA